MTNCTNCASYVNFFLKVMYSQSDDTGIVGVLEIKILTAQPMANLLENFLKILSPYFQLCW